jgi:hypothetical protein
MKQVKIPRIYFFCFAIHEKMRYFTFKIPKVTVAKDPLRPARNRHLGARYTVTGAAKLGRSIFLCESFDLLSETAVNGCAMSEALPEKLNDAPAAAAPPEPVQCPGCNATLYKVSVSRGLKVRCLHCGAKFHPVIPGLADSASEAPIVPIGREPHSPGYFLMRIPAVIFFVVAVFVTIVAGWELMKELARARRGSFEQFVLLSYLPLLPIAGLLAVIWTRTLADIDARVMHLFWKIGIISEPLPPPPGSSLPYIAPLALAGGIIPIWIYRIEPGDASVLTAPAIIGAIVFYLGFAAEDLRQFAWRQTRQARKFYQPKRESAPFPYGAAAIAAGLAFFSIFLLWRYVEILSFSASYNYPDNSYRYQLIQLALWIAPLAGLAVTSFFVLMSVERAVAAWREAAIAKCGDAAVQPRAYLRWLARAPLFWAGYGFIYMLCAFAEKHTPNDGESVWIFVLCLSCLGAVIGLWRVLSGISEWAAAIAALGREKPGAASTEKLAGFTAILLRVTMICVAIEMGLFSVMIWSEFTRPGRRWDALQLFGIPLLIGLIHYPVLWILAVVGEFARVKQNCSSITKVDRHESAGGRLD